MKKFLEKYIDPIVPCYALISLVSLFVINQIIYSGTAILCADWHHYDFTTALDRAVPLIPQFIWIYVLAFPFWIVNYILVTHTGKEHYFRFVTAELIGKTTYLLCFLILPTTNVRPELTGSGLSNALLQFVYRMDGGEAPFNLFPSIHCYVSWMCYLGVKHVKEVPKAYKGFNAVFAILIMLSTQFLKQHYLIDVFAGVALAELVYRLSFSHGWYKKVQRIYEKINGIVHIPQGKGEGLLKNLHGQEKAVRQRKNARSGKTRME